MLWLVSVHALGAVLAPLLVRKLGRSAFLVLALAPASAFLWALTQTSRIADGHPIEQVTPWVPAYGVSLAFRLDPLGLVLLYLAGGIGALVLVYCARYFDSDEPGLGLFACSLTGFAGAMIGLVLADDLILLFVFWELTTILSFLLIGHYADRPTARRSALRAVTVTTFGGLALLAGVVILGQDAGSYRLSAIVSDPPHGKSVSAALVLILVGCFAKSAVFPFSQWLPGAMAAPTPVSAYLHAAAMVKAGVYLIARLAPAYGGDVTWQRLCLGFGGATMLLGGIRALRERDLKRVLAFGTVSQLGFLTAVLGAGQRDTAYAGLAMLLAHAVFKAPLFLGVGIIDHSTGTRDLRKLSGLARSMPALCVVMCLAAASMAGIPPLLGFAAKEAVLDSFVLGAKQGSHTDPFVLAVFVAGSALTVAYTCRVVWGAFARNSITSTCTWPDGPGSACRCCSPRSHGPSAARSSSPVNRSCASTRATRFPTAKTSSTICCSPSSAHHCRSPARYSADRCRSTSARSSSALSPSVRGPSSPAHRGTYRTRHPGGPRVRNSPSRS